MKRILSILLAAMLVIGMLPATSFTALAADGGTWEKATEIAVGDTVVLVYEDGKKELNGTTTSGTKYGIGTGYDSTPQGLMSLTVEEGKTAGTYAFKTEDNKYLYWSSGNSLDVNGTLSNNTSWKVSFSGGNVVIENATASGRTIQWNNSSPRFACYTSSQKAIQMYKFVAAGGEGGEQPEPCQHPNTVKQNVVASTCKKTGSYEVYCPDCEEVIETVTTELADHTYENGVCSVCGAAEPVAPGVVFPEIPTQGNYQLVTELSEVLGGGQYVFVVDYSGKYYALDTTSTLNSGKLAPVETVLSGDYVEKTAPNWRVGSYDGGIVLWDGTNYLGHAAGSGNFTTSATTPFKWTVTDNADGTFLLVSSSDASRAIAYNYNSGNHRFGPYAVSNLDKANYSLRLRIYKLTEGSDVEITSTLTFVENGAVTTATKTYNSAYELPGTSYAVPEGYTFAGWVDAPVENATAQPQTLYAVGDSHRVQGDKTFYALYTKTEETGEGSGAVEYVKTDIGSIKETDVVVVTMTYTKDGTVYALTNGNGTSSAPAGTVVTVSGDKLAETPKDTLKWNIAKENSNLIIYPNGTTATWLYCTATNNGVRVGTNGNKYFTIDATSGYLKNNATSRYVGVFRTNPDWRCYTGTGTNINDQTLGFYVETAGGAAEVTYYTTLVEASCAHGSCLPGTEAGTVVCQFCGITRNVTASIGGTYYETLDEALKNRGSDVVKLQAAVDAIQVTGDLYLDLNGFNVTGSINVNGGTLYGSDSQTDDFTVKDGKGFGRVKVINGDVAMDADVNGGRYIALTDEEEGTSFHRLSVALSTISLRTTQAGVYYKAKISCDEYLAENTQSYGIVLSVNNMPGADFKTEQSDTNAYTVVTGSITNGEEFTSGSVFNIMKQGLDAEVNRIRGEKKIYANAYLDLGKDRIVVADRTVDDEFDDEGFDGIAWSLQDVMETLNESFVLMEDAAVKKRIFDFYDIWKDAMKTWDVQAIAAFEE